MNKILNKIVILTGITSLLLLIPFLNSNDKLSKAFAENETLVYHNNGTGKNAKTSEEKLICNPDYDKSVNLVNVRNEDGFNIENLYSNSFSIDVSDIDYQKFNERAWIDYYCYDTIEFFIFNNWANKYLAFSSVSYYKENDYYWIKYLADTTDYNGTVNELPNYEFYNNNRNYLQFNIDFTDDYGQLNQDDTKSVYFNLYNSVYKKVSSYFSECYYYYYTKSDFNYATGKGAYSYEVYLSYYVNFDSQNKKLIFDYLNISIITPTYTLPIINYLTDNIESIREILYPLSSILYYECYYTWFERKDLYSLNDNKFSFVKYFYYEYETLEFVINIDSLKILELNKYEQCRDYKNFNNNKKIVTYLLYNKNGGFLDNSIDFNFDTSVYNSLENKFKVNKNINIEFSKRATDMILGASMSSGFLVNNCTFEKTLADTCGFNSSYYISMPSGFISNKKLTNDDLNFYDYNKSAIKLYNYYDNYVFGNYYLNYSTSGISANQVYCNYNDLYNTYTYMTTDVFTLGFTEQYNFNDRGLLNLQYANLSYCKENLNTNNDYYFYNFSYGLYDYQNSYYRTFINKNNKVIGKDFYNLLLSDGDFSIDGNNNIVGGDYMYLCPLHQITLACNPALANMGVSTGVYSNGYNNGELEYVTSTGIWDWNANLTNAFIFILNTFPLLKEIRSALYICADYIQITFKIADNIKVLFPTILLSTFAICILCSYLKKTVDK